MSFTKEIHITSLDHNKKPEINKMIKEILPDNRPITGFQVVEDLSKCPKDYNPISRTHDSDSDADLWRAGGGIFARNAQSRRYLCITKSTDANAADYVVDKISVVGEKDPVPDGFTQLSKTGDSKQKAWRKKQLCYRLAKSSDAKEVVTDVILCSRSKRPPDGFSSAGEINGVLVCYKNRDSQTTNEVQLKSPPLPPRNYPFLNLSSNFEHDLSLSPKSPTNENQLLKPKRPAPTPPKTNNQKQPVVNVYNNKPSNNCPGSTYTLNSYTSLDGVPFVVSSKIKDSPNNFSMPPFREFKLTSEYEYNFSLEQQIVNV
ncbi:LOW QUALITY PROTEIN: multivesicular body subunit 12B [Ctenocephalides felis]|uniref:LOW QUALITY PROTEIN: multivesicular body subunit 12B n=1 Tax=Ctenocephalides felis TaxID=7515 RepID=UPI000E6E2DEF|nr:LOW QUALITY PROTEIN: multivesicular body subunit 12B [Ctenocephalides felis]